MAVSDHWTETLKCRHCGLIGVADLAQDQNGVIIVQSLPAGFRAVSSEHGDTFFCQACNRAATTDLK